MFAIVFALQSYVHASKQKNRKTFNFGLSRITCYLGRSMSMPVLTIAVTTYKAKWSVQRTIAQRITNPYSYLRSKVNVEKQTTRVHRARKIGGGSHTFLYLHGFIFTCPFVCTRAVRKQTLHSTFQLISDSYWNTDFVNGRPYCERGMNKTAYFIEWFVSDIMLDRLYILLNYGTSRYINLKICKLMRVAVYRIPNSLQFCLPK